MCLLGEDQNFRERRRKAASERTDGYTGDFSHGQQIGSSRTPFRPSSRWTRLCTGGAAPGALLPSPFSVSRSEKPSKAPLGGQSHQHGQQRLRRWPFCCSNNVATQQPAWKALLSQQGDRADIPAAPELYQRKWACPPPPTPGCQAAQARTGRTQPSTVSPQMQSDFFLPKPRKLRNRHLRKPLVVQVSTPPTCTPP